MFAPSPEVILDRINYNLKTLYIVPPAGGVKIDTILLKEMEIDSLDLVELSLYLEDDFNVDFTECDIENMNTGGDIIKIIQTKISEDITKKIIS